MKYGLMGKFVAQDGKRDELAKILLEAAKMLAQNKDCLSYIVGVSDNPNDVWVSELWETKEAHDASLQPKDIRDLIMTARPLISEMPASIEFHALGGKGL